MTVWIYEAGRPNMKVFATADVARDWFVENDPEGVAFEYEVVTEPLGDEKMSEWTEYKATVTTPSGTSTDAVIGKYRRIGGTVHISVPIGGVISGGPETKNSPPTLALSGSADGLKSGGLKQSDREDSHSVCPSRDNVTALGAPN